MESSSEFRSVHAAKEALAKYIEGGRDINIIKNIPINSIKRYDVWQCVFEKEVAAYRELMIKEYYQDLRKYADEPQKELRTLKAMFCINRFESIVEFKLPLSLKDAIKIAIDSLGDDFLNALLLEAEKSYNRRMEIVKPYYKPDNEWVGYGKTVLDTLKNWK